jgi:hypothetical protein
MPKGYMVNKGTRGTVRWYPSKKTRKGWKYSGCIPKKLTRTLHKKNYRFIYMKK